jgi:cytochrome c oxidase subunit 3
MPAIFTPHGVTTELDRKDPGFGGRPPLRNRPTGGGGDGDSGDDGLGGRGPRELLQRYRLGVSFLLAADLVCFLFLISAFFVRHSSGSFDAADNFVPDWRPLATPLSLWFATAFLVLSSATVEYGRRQLFRELDVIEEWLGMGRPMAHRTYPWLAVTAALGGAYLGCVGLAWRGFAEDGIHFASSPDSAFFFILTGSHALHILAGLVLLAVGMAGLFLLRRVEQRQILVDCIAWFWHAMTAYWLLLFGLLAFSH